MKILVLQLARLGDGLLTWPTLNAIKREHPDAELHLMVRTRFASCTKLMACVDKVHTIDSSSLLSKLEHDGCDFDEITKPIRKIRDLDFDYIINLSFSPSSSFMTQFLAKDKAIVSGYSRFNDGFLNITDNTSSYIRAQVGYGFTNLFHLSDLFSTVAGVDLKFEDWDGRSFETKIPQNYKYTVLHIGASVDEKMLPAEIWCSVIANLLPDYDGVLYLVGSSEERSMSQEICHHISSSRLVDLVGETSIEELRDLIQGAEGYIGADSGPLHLASLTGTPALNLSVGPVSAFETGPKSAGSRILIEPNPERVSAYMVVDEYLAMIERRASPNQAIGVVSPIEEYRHSLATRYEQEVVKYIYLDGPTPLTKQKKVTEALIELADIYEVAIEQCQAIELNNRDKIAAGILDRCDETMMVLARKVPEISPLVRWFMTEKTRIGPAPLEEVLETTKRYYYNLGNTLYGLLTRSSNVERSGERNAR